MIKMKIITSKSGFSSHRLASWLFTFLLLNSSNFLLAQDRNTIEVFSHQSEVSTDVSSISDFYDDIDNVSRISQISISEELKSPFHLKPDDLLEIVLFDESVTAKVIFIEQSIAGTTTLAAKINGSDFGYFIVSTTDGRSYANLTLPEVSSFYEITSNPNTLQHHLMELDLDAASFPEGGPTLIPSDITDEQLIEQVRIKEELQGRNTGPFDPAVIDLMFVYTPQAKNTADNSGGGLMNRLANKLAWGQIALNNSNVVLTIRLVHITETIYTESGNTVTDLDRFIETSDGFMDEIHTKRDASGADLCVLFTSTGSFAGLAALLNNINGVPAWGFSLTRITQNPIGLTFIHEVAHNLGCSHHKEQNVEPGPTVWTNWPANTWSAGWVWQGFSGTHFCSVMSYTPANNYNPPFNSNSYTRVPHFSSPLSLHDGVFAGHPGDGDNARTIRETKHVVAAYRSTVADCKPCPEFDFDIAPSTSWQTHSSTIPAAYDCKIYRVAVDSGNIYSFKTGCGDGASASFDTYLELLSDSCFMLAYNDNGCESNRSIVYQNFTYTGYAYLRVRSGNTGSGSYTLAYNSGLYSDPCSSVSHIGGVGPAHTQSFTGGGTGSWFNSLPNTCGTMALGYQELFSFNPPSNGLYNIQVTSATGQVDYQWGFICSPTPPFCIGSTDVVTMLGPETLFAGTTMHFMLEKRDTQPGSHTFYIELACGAVSNLQVSAGTTTASVTWTEPVPQPLSYEVTLYDIFQVPVSSVILPPGSTGHIFIGLNPSTHYDLQVVSICSGGLTIDEWINFMTRGFEFGDAPEGSAAYPTMGIIGQFPTCMSLGPPASFIRHDGNHELFFGSSVDYEHDGNAGFCNWSDPYNSDECANDGDAGILMPGSFTLLHVGTQLTVPCDASSTNILGYPCSDAIWGSDIDIYVENNLSQTTYFNLLVDWDQDGIWGGNSLCTLISTAEHAVVNFPIPPFFTGALSQLLLPDIHIGPNEGWVWTRFTISELPVPASWDGSGIFANGETEDYLLQIGSISGSCVPPSNFAANPSINEADLSWIEPFPPAQGGYIIEVIEFNTGIPVFLGIVPSGTTNFVIPGLTASTFYQATIYSDCGGNLSYAQVTTFSTFATGTCNAVTGLTVQVGSTYAGLSWIPPMPTPQTGIEVELRDNNGATIVIYGGFGQNGLTIHGLTPNSTYTAIVRSICIIPQFAEEAITFTTSQLGYYDFGDAPENSHAYPWNSIVGQFPTCMNTGSAGSYIKHEDNPGLFFGPSVDYELEGNEGNCPVFNPNQYNMDECFQDGDAGLIMPVPYTITGPVGNEQLVPCIPGSPVSWKACRMAVWGVSVDIHVENQIASDAYFNLLVDWDTDGSWGGSSLCQGTSAAEEHAVVNFVVPAGFSGPLSLLSPPKFRIGENPGGVVWARFTISEQPVVLPWNGSGSYSHGETEDYLIHVVTANLQDDLYIDSFHFLPGFDDCFEAESNIVIENSQVDSGADVKLVAGNSIRFLPATTIEHGAQLLARIDTDGNYCSNYKTMLNIDGETPQAELPSELVDSKAMFRVFPNPTPGHFTLELKNIDKASTIFTEIYSILGERILKQELPAMQQYHFDLSGHQPGIYFIRVMQGNEVGVEKIIRK